MWDFDIVHVAGKKNVVADALLRRLEEDGWELLDEPEDDVEDFIDLYLNAIRLDFGPEAPLPTALLYGTTSVDLSFSESPLDGAYSDES